MIPSHNLLVLLVLLVLQVQTVVTHQCQLRLHALSLSLKTGTMTRVILRTEEFICRTVGPSSLLF